MYLQLDYRRNYAERKRNHKGLLLPADGHAVRENGIRYLYLRERSNKGGTCFPSIPTVSRDTGLSEATVKRAIQDLTAAGWYKKNPVSEETGQGAAICIC